MKQNIIQTRTFDFAVDTIQLYKRMTAKNEFVLSKQLLRSGTSIGANAEEALGGQSKRDFLSKMNNSLKEAREANYWLRLFKASGIVDVDFDASLKESQELINILSATVKTTRQNS